MAVFYRRNVDKESFKPLVEGEDYNLFVDGVHLYWDNDVVALNKEHVKQLIPILQEWLGGL